MPSKLPIIKANTSYENISKMKVIASANKRSVAKELEWLIERHIAEYEQEHGEIETLVTVTTDKEDTLAERAKKSFRMGLDVGSGKKKMGDVLK